MNLSFEMPEKVWIADAYAENNRLQEELTARFFFSVYQWRGSENVLDIGSGDGRITARLAGYAPLGTVTGWDYSPSMIAHAKSRYSLANLLFELKDASLLQSYKKAAFFDVVVSFHALHWMDNQLAILEGIKHVLKEGGKAYLLVASDGDDPLQQIADDLSKSLKWQSFFTAFKDPLHRFSVAEYKALLKQAGLIPLSVIEVVKDDPLHSKEDLAGQIISWVPHVKFLPEKFQRDFVDDMVDEFMKRECPGLIHPNHLRDCNLEIIAER